VPSSFWPGLAAAIAVGLVVPRDARVVRIGVGLYALAIVASFVLETPMGGNVVRLGALFAGPVVVALLWLRDRRTVYLLALPLLYWQWIAPIDDWARAAGDASVHERYYDGMLGFLARQGDGPFRVEIPFTDNHWESRWVAPHVPLARGWERQVDRERNALFYDDRPITAGRYRRWLDDNAVRFVALPDAPLDYAARREAALLRHPPAFLRPAWRDRHWKVFAVRGARPLASGPATLESLGPDRFALSVTTPGTVTVRVRFSPYWAVTSGRGCVGPAARGWTRVRAAEAGPLEVAIRFSPARLVQRGARCT
jgi:hypothetical protein